MPPSDVVSGRRKAGTLNEHHNGTGNLYVARALLRWAATLATPSSGRPPGGYNVIRIGQPP